ncbi:unnamed protein product [Prorocentrum cordatum]|uniref:Uncharacterized protein n=1 Tax=Prorocentrum cordatum TaxID=2364126 RepID=A0ABN9W5C1_9DINO|nr:unnamed protein product [Polarella glacialis]
MHVCGHADGPAAAEDKEALLLAAVSWLRSLGDVPALLVRGFNLVLHGASVEPLLAMAGWPDALAQAGPICLPSPGGPSRIDYVFANALAMERVAAAGLRWDLGLATHAALEVGLAVEAAMREWLSRRMRCLGPLARQRADARWRARRPRASGAGGEASDEAADAALHRMPRLRPMRRVASRRGRGGNRARAVAAAPVRGGHAGAAWAADLQRPTLAPGLLERGVALAELGHRGAQRAARDRRRGSWRERARRAMGNGGGRWPEWILRTAPWRPPLCQTLPRAPLPGHRPRRVVVDAGAAPCEAALPPNSATRGIAGGHCGSDRFQRPPAFGEEWLVELDSLPPFPDRAPWAADLAQLLEWVAELFESVEQTGRWPEKRRGPEGLLLLKPGGGGPLGRMPIWPLPMLRRVCAAGRAQLQARWRAAWGGADGGVGSEGLARDLALEREAAEASGETICLGPKAAACIALALQAARALWAGELALRGAARPPQPTLEQLVPLALRQPRCAACESPGWAMRSTEHVFVAAWSWAERRKVAPRRPCFAHLAGDVDRWATGRLLAADELAPEAAKALHGALCSSVAAGREGPQLPAQAALLPTAPRRTVCSDEACLHPVDPLLARAARGLQVKGLATPNLVGPVDGLQTAQRADVTAAVAAARVAGGPVDFAWDSQCAARGCAKIEAGADPRDWAHADLWHSLVDAVRSGRLWARWVPAHKTPAEARRLGLSERGRFGNAAADGNAGAAAANRAALAAAPPAARRRQRDWRRVRRGDRARAASALAADAPAGHMAQAPTCPRRSGADAPVSNGDMLAAFFARRSWWPHALARGPGHVFCPRCGGSATSAAGLLGSSCLGWR